MSEFFNNLWTSLVNIYGMYSDFVHSIFPSQLGDLVVYLLDIVIVIAIVKIVASFAFTTKGGD